MATTLDPLGGGFLRSGPGGTTLFRADGLRSHPFRSLIGKHSVGKGFLRQDTSGIRAIDKE
jgi:hypothetical protein